MRRREFLGSIATAACASPLALAVDNRGPSILVHEHVLVDFIGADKIARDRYDLREAFLAAKPHLEKLKARGCVRMLECTPNYIGRDPRLLRMLSDAVGMELWTNTGLYAAADHKFLPAFAKTESAEQLAKRWITEWENGVDGMKPRFIKIGVNKGPLHEWDRKVVKAAALTSKETGLTIAAHTGDGAAAREELDIVLHTGAAAGKFVWVHAQNEKDHAVHLEVAKAGAWVEFDSINAGSVDWHQNCVEFMASAGVLNQTLISHDSGWYRPGEPGGGTFNGYTYLYDSFHPKVDGWFRKLLWENPRKAFG